MALNDLEKKFDQLYFMNFTECFMSQSYKIKNFHLRRKILIIYECNMAFLHYSTSSKLKSVGLNHISGKEGGWMFRVCKIISNPLYGTISELSKQLCCGSHKSPGN